MKNININGAKNGALPVLAATLLQQNLYYIRNVPLITDIEVQINILKQFNVKVWYINKNNLIIDSTNLLIPKVIDYSKNTRGTYYFIGSTVIYNKDLEYILETGCKIDVRSIDYHLTLLELLGKKIIINNNKLFISGNFINENVNYTFPKASIGATINAIFMFSRCKSIITLNNYAKDPYIINTIELLIKIGINIQYNDYSIIINGHDSKFIKNTLIDHSIIEDPIEALTYIIYAGINLSNYSKSNYTIGPININNFGESYTLLESIGITLIESETLKYYYINKTEFKSFETSTGYFPSVYTDIQPFLTILALFVKNSVCKITENIWNDRFKYVNEINKFGFNILIKEKEIIIDTTTISDNNIKFEEIDYYCTDLRGGMALLLLMRKIILKRNRLIKII